jgi:hypothetical protein
MQHFKLLGGQTPEELWWLTNSSLPGLILMIILPRWKHTKIISLIGPLLAALVYTLGIISAVIYPEVEPDPNANFLTLEGVMAVFNNEIGVYLGWMHYVVFDALVARWIMLDSIEEKDCSVMLHVFLVVPCMFFCIMAGPMGFLMYMILRNFIPSSTSKPKRS